MSPLISWRLILSALFIIAWSRPGLAAPDLTLAITLDPETRQFTAQAEWQPAQRKVRFFLHESLHVSSATVDGRRLPVEQAPAGPGYKLWSLYLAQTKQALTLNYAGQLPPLERNRDHRSVLGGMPPMAAPEGSFLSAGSAWYPRPADLFSYRVTLSLPGNQRGLVPGRRVSEILPGKPGERYQATFEFTEPSDGIDLMAGPWIVREKSVNRPGQPPLFLRTYFPADLDAVSGLAQAYLDDSQRYIERYSKQIGAYPYSEFSVVASPLPTGFGMPTLTYIGADVLRLPFIRQTSLGHEILHNWWGNGVHVDYQRGNWSEGLTTFMADYAYKEEESAAAAGEVRLAWLRDAAALTAAQESTLRDFRSRANAAEATVGYGKSAMLFFMLRERLGNKVFDQGIRDFWTTYRFRTASWDDLQKTFEKASGETLGDFFLPWLTQKSLPEITISHASSSGSGKKYRLDLRFEKSEAALPLRLPIQINAGNRQETRLIALAPQSSSASIELDFKPETLRLDPEVHVWRRLTAGQLPPVLREWIGARAPRLLNAAASPEEIVAVNQLSGRIFETAPKALDMAALANTLTGKQPVLIVGTHGSIDKIIAKAGLPPRPASLAGQGTAQVWTVEGKPYRLAFISADNAATINALQRGLPHYGGQSWLIFDQASAIKKGVWPASVPETAVSPTQTSKDKN